MNSKNLNVDITKGIAIILVIIGHSGMFLFIKDKVFLNTFIYSFHMPLFFIVSGFFMKDKMTFLKTIKRLLIPFLLASIFWVFIASFLVQLPTFFRSQELYPYSYDFIKQFKLFMKSIIFATRVDIKGTGLWFLIALFVSRLFWFLFQVLLKIKVTLYYIGIVLILNLLLYKYLTLSEVYYYWMWPQSILAYFFMISGNYFNEKNSIKKFTYFDVFILAIISCFIILWNGRIDMSIFRFNNYIAFIFSSFIAFITIYKLTFLIEKKSNIITKFLAWSGRNSLNIFLFHPFLLAICSYILIANFNIKDVYSRVDCYILICFIIFSSVYAYSNFKRFIK